MDETQGGAYLARMWLANTLAGVNVSINYDWRDGGTDLTNCEGNFGSVRSTVRGEETESSALALMTSGSTHIDLSWCSLTLRVVASTTGNRQRGESVSAEAKVHCGPHSAGQPRLLYTFSVRRC